MTNRERNVLILVLAILAGCGLVTLVSPAPAEPGARATPEGTLPSAAFTRVPASTSTLVPTPSSSPTHTPVPTHTPAPTHTRLPASTPTAAATAAPTSTALPTETPAPTDPPPAATPTTAATAAPTQTALPTETPAPTDPPPAATTTTVAAEASPPTATPAAALSLAMDWMLVQKGCVSEAQWMVEIWLTAEGGTGEYTFYRDAERLLGPVRMPGMVYQMHTDAGRAAEGIFVVESGAQRVQSEFWVERLDCRPTPTAPPTTGAAGSPLSPPGASP